MEKIIKWFKESKPLLLESGGLIVGVLGGIMEINNFCARDLPDFINRSVSDPNTLLGLIFLAAGVHIITQGDRLLKIQERDRNRFENFQEGEI